VRKMTGGPFGPSPNSKTEVRAAQQPRASAVHMTAPQPSDDGALQKRKWPFAGVDPKTSYTGLL
jgi:hypothetical protein